MHVTEIIIEGDVPGHDWTVPVINYEGHADGPKTYIQAALHAGELPGAVAAHYLAGLLAEAEKRGEILGDITLIPQANPIGAAQWMNGEMQGRFDFASRVNFNRGYPIICLEDRARLLDGLDRHHAVEQIKRRLISMALAADLVLDLHCDDQSLPYAYIHGAFWPEAADLAAALDAQAVLLSDGLDDSFEDAVVRAWLNPQKDKVVTALPGRICATVELRGTADVDPVLAQKDAAGIYRFLQQRGVIGGTTTPLGTFDGPAEPLENIEMVNAHVAGAILFHRNIGEAVKKGDLLATLIAAPGMEGSEYNVFAPQDGLIVTRISVRYARRGDNLMKIACANPTAEIRKGGALED